MRHVVCTSKSTVLCVPSRVLYVYTLGSGEWRLERDRHTERATRLFPGAPRAPPAAPRARGASGELRVLVLVALHEFEKD